MDTEEVTMIEMDSSATEKMLFHHEDGNLDSEATLIWRHLSYAVKDPRGSLESSKTNKNKKSPEKVIVHNQSGHLAAGELVAIIGPSGAGKTTLLECLSGRRKAGMSGSVLVSGKCTNEDITLSFLGQKDSLLGRLTVRETLTFAAKLKNTDFRHKKEFDVVVDNVLQQLNMSKCAHTLAMKCSGGQRKRLSIGLELINRPKILVLDEPTSGLDSTSAIQCVQFLREVISNQRIAIIASIHQPSASLLSLFHKVMVMSHDGRLLYFDKVDMLNHHLASFGYNCPPLHNLADYAIELSSGIKGQEPVEKLADQATTRSEESSSCSLENMDVEEMSELQTTTVSVRRIVDKMQSNSSAHFWHHVALLTCRTFKCTLRTPWLNYLRFIAHIFAAATVSALYSSGVGEADGCVRSLSLGGLDTSGDLKEQFYSLVRHIQTQENRAQNNLSYFFFSLMFLLFNAIMFTVMTFPMSMGVFLKERSNGCYSCLAYYAAETLADLPFTLANAAFYMLITFYYTGQVLELERFTIVFLVCFIICMIGQSIGLMSGAIFAHKPDQAVFSAPLSTLPLLLFSGYFLKVDSMPSFLRPISYLSYWRYGFEAIIIAIFGRNRCSTDLISNPINEGRGNFSLPLNACSVFGRLAKLIDESNISTDSAMSMFSWSFAGKPEAMNTLEQIKTDMELLRQNAINRTMSAGSSNLTQIFYQDSYVMTHFNLDDEHLWTCLLILLVIIFVHRVVAYFALYFKAAARN